MNDVDSMLDTPQVQEVENVCEQSDYTQQSFKRSEGGDIRHTTLSDVDMSHINISYEIYAESAIGGRKENQDYYSALETPYGLLLLVCDGMGGANGGAIASKLAVNTIVERIEEHPTYDTPRELLHDVIEYANLVVYQRSVSDPQLSGMGTTIVAMLLSEQKATVAHVGDSRLYQIRDKRRIFRTFDHSMVFELVRRGSITEEEARLSAGSNVILQALGTKPTVDNIEITDDIPYKKGDRFLLCSDGVCGAVPESKVLELSVFDRSVETTVNKMIQTINDIGLADGGGHDNLTSIILEVKTNSILGGRGKEGKVVLYAYIAIAIFVVISLIAIVWYFIFNR